MKVLIVLPQLKFYGGAELLVVELANYLTSVGIENTILSLSKSEAVEKNLKNTKIIIPRGSSLVRITESFVSPMDLVRAILIFRKTIKKIRKNYDIISFHNFPVTWALFPYKARTVWMCNEPPSLWSRPEAGLMLKFLNKIRSITDRIIVRQSMNVICVADKFNQKRVKEQYGRNSQIVNYGIDYLFFSSGQKRHAISEFGLSGKFVIIQSGMVTLQKNQLESIKTVGRLKDKIPNILLVLAGKIEPSYGSLLADYIEKNNLEKHILFTGNLTRDKLRNIYAACDVGLFPIKSQGGWLAPFELLCSAKPVIVSKEFTAAELVQKNGLGIVTDNYFEAILKIYKNKKNYGKISKKAALFVKNELSWENFGKKFIDIFEKLVGEHHSAQ